MIFSNRNRKPKSYTKQRVVAIVRQKSKPNSSHFQGTIDYKNVILLRKFITAEGKILPRRISGLNAKQQRYMAKAIKNARMIGLLPFINHSQPPRI
jgi:small subunit ribosomal protein S18